jgi:hypothetical protein
VATQKKSQKKPSSTSTGRRLTQEQYEANFNDVSATFSNALEAVERLELDLKRIKNKLNCFCHGNRFSPVHGPSCPKK